ncbi:MAG: beta-hydroxyacyl-ACP dehydratase [Phaeodactylibacter sp.]|nr:beta-hydroxyacyl-ACP dehydratase [Phaeodactylibacter sp.]
MTTSNILELLPYAAPFRFVDELEHVDERGVTGYYTFSPEADFYRGHFPGNPITPGVILSETMAQIGLVPLGIFLLQDKIQSEQQLGVAFSSQSVDYLYPIYPGERVKVISEKIYFRFNKLKCKVSLYNAQSELACKGELAGMCHVLTPKL